MGSTQKGKDVPVHVIQTYMRNVGTSVVWSASRSSRYIPKKTATASTDEGTGGPKEPIWTF